MQPHEPMLRYIRKNVKRPGKLPIVNKVFHRGKFKEILRFECGKCPMGFIVGSTYPTPTDREDFEEVRNFPKNMSDKKIEAFGNWWDRKKDPKRAVESIWGKGK